MISTLLALGLLVCPETIACWVDAIGALSHIFLQFFEKRLCSARKQQVFGMHRPLSSHSAPEPADVSFRTMI
jgi:hypothetical protein